MIDAFVRMKAGEQRPVYAQVTAQTGTLTIQAGGVVTLVDQAGDATGAAAAVTGYDVSALAAPRVWYLLDTTALDPGIYTLEFAITALGSDTITRVYEPVVMVEVDEAIPVVATP
jgi:hypothetical protein